MYNGHHDKECQQGADILPEGNNCRETHCLANTRAQELAHHLQPRGKGDVGNKNSRYHQFSLLRDTHLYIFVIFFYPVKTMSLNYGSLEEVHGAPFGTRVPITKEQQASKLDQPIEQRQDRAASKRVQAAVDAVTPSLPLDKDPATETFVVRPAPVEKFTLARERFTDPQPMSHADAAAEEKLTRILRLIEQNRTGYERPAVQDMVLYIFTGVFFLFAFDTFVQLGKGMRPGKGGRKGSQRT